ncbi:hypothetical protein CEXT_160581 [Caerostris extrusa]|uniref:Uncharacterized protein n=1 Tax=Caerostris extrusa TaxID=172846 RepID=A0AAV4YGH6_CAEEX|nr:hypothetical protein CEXT_160581 [Caerostris extrusa]
MGLANIPSSVLRKKELSFKNIFIGTIACRSLFARSQFQAAVDRSGITAAGEQLTSLRYASGACSWNIFPLPGLNWTPENFGYSFTRISLIFVDKSSKPSRRQLKKHIPLQPLIDSPDILSSAIAPPNYPLPSVWWGWNVQEQTSNSDDHLRCSGTSLPVLMEHLKLDDFRSRRASNVLHR